MSLLNVFEDSASVSYRVEVLTGEVDQPAASLEKENGGGLEKKE
jgi:hypothetical protein